MVEVPDPAFSYYMIFAVPANDKIVDYISFWTIKFRQDGMVLSLRRKYVDDISPDVCQHASAKDSDTTSLDLKSMAGTFVISGTFMLIGVIWWACEQIRCRVIGPTQAKAGAEETTELGRGHGEEGLDKDDLFIADCIHTNRSGLLAGSHNARHLGHRFAPALFSNPFLQMAPPDYSLLDQAL